MYLLKVTSLVNTKNAAIGDVRFNCFQHGAIMAWVSNQTNKPSYYADKHPHLTE